MVFIDHFETMRTGDLKKGTHLPDGPKIIPELNEHILSIEGNEKAFHMPQFGHRALKYDLAKTGIPDETKEGFADFHSLRYTFIPRLVKSGINIRTAQILARHTDPRLTLAVYSPIQLLDQFQAIKKIPTLETREEKTRGDCDRNRITVGKVSAYFRQSGVFFFLYVAK